MTTFAFDRGGQRNDSVETYRPDYSEELSMVETPEALVDHLDELLTGNRMSAVEKADIVDILNTLPISTSSQQREAEDRLEIVQTAVALVTNSPSYAVTW